MLATHNHNKDGLFSTTNKVWFEIVNGAIKRPYHCFWVLTDQNETRSVTTSASMLAIRQDEACLFQFNHPGPLSQRNIRSLFGTNKIIGEWEKRWKARCSKLVLSKESCKRTQSRYQWIRALFNSVVWIFVVFTALAFFLFN